MDKCVFSLDEKYVIFVDEKCVIFVDGKYAIVERRSGAAVRRPTAAPFRRSTKVVVQFVERVRPAAAPVVRVTVLFNHFRIRHFQWYW